MPSESFGLDICGHAVPLHSLPCSAAVLCCAVVWCVYVDKKPNRSKRPNGDEDPNSIHAAETVMGGEKWIATRWMKDAQ